MPKILNDAARARVEIAVHEAGHAVMGTLLGGTIHTVVIAEGASFGVSGLTTFDELPDHLTASVAYAGPWAESRFRHGPRASLPQTWAVLDACGRKDRDAIVAAVGSSTPPNASTIARHLTTCWPAVAEIASALYKSGEVRHADVLAALSVTDGGGPGSGQLANIKAGLQIPRPVVHEHAT